jgi:hypothetical protein
MTATFPRDQALAAALRKLRNSRITETHVATDRIFSDHRIALQGAEVEWLQGVAQKKAK